MAFEALGQDVLIVLTLLLLEAVLSFDNAAVLAALVRKLPQKDRKKALLYGLVGAYVLRIAAILLVAVLIRNPWLTLVGGGYLVFLGLKHFLNVLRHREEHHHVTFQTTWLVRLGVSPLVATIIQIELVDLAFALDQVVAARAFTDQVPLIIIASLVGILSLRLAAAFIARIMDWIPLLEHMAYVAVTFVGLKLLLEYDAIDIHVPTGLSIGVTLGLFGLPVLMKLIFGIPRSAPGTHQQVEEQGQR